MTDILSPVERRFGPPFWVFMREFRNDTGFNATRIADALAVGLYSSHGQVVIGFEVKTSRADWLREMRDPEKSDSIGKYCNHWNLVISDKSIVDISEVPPNWGLILSSGKRMIALKKAPEIRAEPIPLHLLAAILKRAVDNAHASHKESRDEKIERAEREDFDRGKLVAAGELKRYADLQENVERFEKASGVVINQWVYGTQIGKAVKALLGVDDSVRRASSDAGIAIANVERSLNFLKQYRMDLDLIIKGKR